MMTMFKILAVSFLLMGVSPASAAETEQIGTILEIEGKATITPAGGTSAAAAVDTPVHLNDVIATEAGAKAFVQLIDGSEFTLSENGSLKIDDYIYNPENVSSNKARYSVLRGAFLYTSGLIAKKDKPDVKVVTPYGSIGIRGTQFWGGTIDKAYGILVNEGEVVVANFTGEVALTKGQGTTLTAKDAKPGEVKAWGKAKIDRAVAMISLKNPGLVMQRIAVRKELNQKILDRRREMREERRNRVRNNKDQAPGKPWKKPE